MFRLNKIFLQISVFIVVLFGLHKTIGFFYLPWIKSSQSYEITRRQFEEVLPQTSILILGDSHSKFSIDPAYINGSFNLSFNGENYMQTYYKVKYYLENSQAEIKLIILPVDLHSFSSYRENGFQDVTFWKRYINFIELGKSKGDASMYSKEFLLGEFSYLGGMDETIEKILGVEDKDSWKISMGFISESQELPEILDPKTQADILSRVERQFNGEKYISKNLSKYFIMLLELANENDVSVVLVWFPITEYYYSLASQYIPVNKHIERINELLESNGFSYPILDYHDIFWGQNQLFANGDHLNGKGAVQFSPILKSDLLKINLLPTVETSQSTLNP